MGPKKKKSGGGSKKEAPYMIDGQSTSEMTKEQLEEYSKRLQEEKDRANEERNYFQLERDQIATFWKITEQILSEMKSKLRTIECEVELEEEQHQVEIKIYKQRVKHIIHEQEENIVRLRTMGAAALTLAEGEFKGKRDTLMKDNRVLRVSLKEHELSEVDVRKELLRENDKVITKLRIDFQKELNEQLYKFQKQTEETRKNFELKRRTDIHEIEERKNVHIQRLMKNHEKAFNEVKLYYNEITMNNLALINSLKKDVEQLKKTEEVLESNIHDLTTENRKLLDPLNKANHELQDLHKQLSNYVMDKLSLQRAKSQIKSQGKELKRLNYEEEVQKQMCGQLKSERDDLMKHFQTSLEEIQQKSNLKNLLLEQKLEKIAENLEIKDSQFNELLVASNLDEKSLSIVGRKIEEVLGSKNAVIKNLRFEVSRIAKSHNDLIRTYTTHLEKMGVPAANLGFEPLQPRTKGRDLGRGVAGLVSKPHS